MGNDFAENEDHPDLAIQVGDENEHLLELMEKKISAAPGILRKSAGRSSCCIFRAPKSFNDINGQQYQPQIVSIGPYHHGKPELAMIEEHKWRFLGILLKRTEDKGLKLKDYLKAVKPLVAESRDCYAEGFQFSSDEFIQMLVLDGCFVIELFRKFSGVVTFDRDDPLFSMSWVLSFFLRDLIRLENQIPFFILRRLFEITKMPDEEDSGLSLGRLTLNFFNYAIQRPESSLELFSDIDGKHILDFLRLSFIPVGDEEPRIKPGKFSDVRLINCISDLRWGGIRLKPGNEESFLDVRFRGGVIEMPRISLDDYMSSFLLNCVAYEQCHGNSSKHMTTYTTLLDCLINTSKDVKHLCDWNIMENYFGTEDEIAKFVNNMGKDVVFDIESCYLSRLFSEVNQYYQEDWYVQFYVFLHTPWKFVSSLAAFVLLLLAVLQTLYTILSYVHPK
ncbi:OLC1v1031954C1 [Oldenlandia corymbosa var. corymbosa]|uniref:OLC1v1031954C1 n=1 Tax=Oldenlandia corymbosa var. corymbosa TaxID=529605 RepID=A0AAV1CKG8_OLDCO|nr:OLC1v1031954C1 [Oldenlandia corymbosa var. corymbosa]